MKLLLLFALTLLVQSGVSQTATEEPEVNQTTREELETTGSGMTTVDPCDEVECLDDSTCVNGDCECDAGFIKDDNSCIQVVPCDEVECPDNSTCVNGDCECNAGFIKDDNSCIQVCMSKEIQVNNTGVNKDVNCSDSSYEPKTTNITVFFEDARVGAYSSANVTCSETCNNKPRSIGAMKCESGGVWSVPVWTNCSAVDQSPEDDLQDTLISTSNVDEITVEDVGNAIDAIAAVLVDAGEDLLEEVANDAIETINNLLQATDENANEEVTDSSKKILDSIENIGNAVVLNTLRPGYNFFENIVSNIALCVVGRTVPTTRAFPDENYFFSLTKRSSNLADSGVVLSITEQIGSSYIRAKPTSADGRISFQLYSETGNLFSNLVNDIVDGVIFAISGDAVNEFTIKFKIDSNITVTESNNFEQGEKMYRLRAMRWNTNTTTWIQADDNECYSYSADSSFATMTCNVTGQYSLRREEIAKPTTEEPVTQRPVTKAYVPLSGAAIAGIVIGSLVGVALIVGIVVYCLKFKNKSVGVE